MSGTNATKSVEPSVAVVIPAHRAEGMIPRVLEAVFASGFAPGEVLVVDDGSPDAVGEVARGMGVRVVRNETAQRPAGARNRGVEEVEADIVFFVDADVVIHPGARARILAAFAADPGLVAVFGSYDTRPPQDTVLSRYRNLLHHFVHQVAPAEAQSFWTGCGAVRREAFLAVGGFDPNWQDIEDVELGRRLIRAGGRIRLDRDLLCTHLKLWTPRSFWKTDLYGRAIPWSRLMLFEDMPPGALNAGTGHKISVAAVAAALVGLAGGLLIEDDLLWLVPFAVAGFLAANARFLAFLAETEGWGFALRALPWHAAHYLAAGLGFAWVLATEYLPTRFGGGKPGPERPASG